MSPNSVWRKGFEPSLQPRNRHLVGLGTYPHAFVTGLGVAATEYLLGAKCACPERSKVRTLPGCKPVL